MTHDEQRKYLIQKLLDEDIQYKDVVIPEDVQQQKLLLRSLMNVRLPKAVSREFMEVQDNYLSDERDAAGVVDAASLPVVPQYPRLVLWQGDITVLNCDAIVNAANSQMCGCFRALHSCIDNIVHTKAGIALRLKLCRNKAAKNLPGRRRLHQHTICRANIYFTPLAQSSKRDIQVSSRKSSSRPAIVPVYSLHLNTGARALLFAVSQPAFLCFQTGRQPRLRLRQSKMFSLWIQGLRELSLMYLKT